MTETSSIATQGQLLWSGEHWIAYLRSRPAQHPTAMVSLYHAHASPAGRGTAAFVQIDGDPGFAALCTDNTEFANFVKETQVSPSAPYDVDMPLATARFCQTGHLLERPSWHIAAGGREIGVTWWDLDQPLVGPPTANPKIVFTVLVFAERASIELDGRAATGDPYPREIWAPSLGKPMSSCVFALAETMVR